MMRKMFFMGLLALGFLAPSCSDGDVLNENENGNEIEAKTGEICVTIKGEQPVTKAVGTPSTDIEKTVKSFTVYVFNNNTGVLEKTATINQGLTAQITGLSVSSQKKVVVLVNEPSGYTLGTNYTDFQNASTMINLDSQVPGDFSTIGLFMSGEYTTPVQLDADNTVQITIPVKRITTKIRLGSLTINPASGVSLTDFNLTGVSIQKARNYSPALGGLATTGFNYVSGISTDQNNKKDYLHESYTLPMGYTAGTKLTPNIYFYIFPNDNTDNQLTMFTLYGTYLGKTVYYTFNINDKISTGNNPTDGNHIERNKIYTLNVNLQKLGNGGDNPDVPNQEANMDVTISVSDWDAELIQDVEW